MNYCHPGFWIPNKRQTLFRGGGVQEAELAKKRWVMNGEEGNLGEKVLVATLQQDTSMV